MKTNGSNANQVATTQPKQGTLGEWLKERKESFLQALPANTVNVDRFMQSAMLAITNPKMPNLVKCSKESIFRSLKEAAAYGLELNGMLGQAYLIPYNEKGVMTAHLQLGYKGLIALARRSNTIKTIAAEPIHENDIFEVELGMGRKLSHKIDIMKERGEVIGYYCLVELCNGGSQFKVMSKKDVENHRNKFSKAYDVKFTNRDNKEEYAYYTTWGKTTRAIAAIIMVHADNYGLVLPPRVAPRQVVIIPIGKDDEVISKAKEMNDVLNNAGVISYIDNSDKSPGFKFAEAEVNGIPIRIELGKRDFDNNQITFVRRDTREKITESMDVDVVDYVKDLLETIQNDMYKKAIERRDNLTFEAKTLEDMEKILNTQPGFIHADWCGNEECENKIKEIKGCKSRCITDDELLTGKCVCCGKEAKYHVIWGIQY